MKLFDLCETLETSTKKEHHLATSEIWQDFKGQYFLLVKLFENELPEEEKMSTDRPIVEKNLSVSRPKPGHYLSNLLQEYADKLHSGDRIVSMELQSLEWLVTGDAKQQVMVEEFKQQVNHADIPGAVMSLQKIANTADITLRM